jgi:hypothetical protein
MTMRSLSYIIRVRRAPGWEGINFPDERGYDVRSGTGERKNDDHVTSRMI